MLIRIRARRFIELIEVAPYSASSASQLTLQPEDGTTIKVKKRHRPQVHPSDHSYKENGETTFRERRSCFTFHFLVGQMKMT